MCRNCAKFVQIVQNCAKLCETGVLVGDFFVGTLVFANVRAILKNMFLGQRLSAFGKGNWEAIAQELHKIDQKSVLILLVGFRRRTRKLSSVFVGDFIVGTMIFGIVLTMGKIGVSRFEAVCFRSKQFDGDCTPHCSNA